MDEQGISVSNNKAIHEAIKTRNDLQEKTITIQGKDVKVYEIKPVEQSKTAGMNQSISQSLSVEQSQTMSR